MKFDSLLLKFEYINNTACLFCPKPSNNGVFKQPVFKEDPDFRLIMYWYFRQ